MDDGERKPNANSIVKMWLLKRGHPPDKIRTDYKLNEIRLSWFSMNEWWPFCWLVDGNFYLGDDHGSLILTPPERPDFFAALEARYLTKREIAQAYHALKMLQPNMLREQAKDDNRSVDQLRKWIKEPQ